MQYVEVCSERSAKARQPNASLGNKLPLRSDPLGLVIHLRMETVG